MFRLIQKKLRKSQSQKPKTRVKLNYSQSSRPKKSKYSQKLKGITDEVANQETGGLEEPTSPEGKNQIDAQQLMLMKQRHRISEWLSQQLSSNTELVRSLREGIHGSASVFNHKFREVDKKKELSKLPMLNRR